jgi:hypothetical protein
VAFLFIYFIVYNNLRQAGISVMHSDNTEIYLFLMNVGAVS